MRFLIRLILVLLLGGVVWLVGNAWLQGTGDYLTKAQEAVKSNKPAEAELHLKNVLKTEPQNSEAHRLMSEVILAQAKTDELANDTYQTNDAARTHLASAAKFNPEDLDLQKQVVGIFLDRGALGAAAEFAETVVESEPDNADALVSLSSRAIRANKRDEAKGYLEKLEADGGDRFFRAAAVAMEVYEPESDPEKRSEVLDGVVEKAAETEFKEFAALPADEQLLVPQLLRAAVQEAPDVPTAHRRVAGTLGFCERISGAAEMPPEFSTLAADVMATLKREHPDPGVEKPARLELEKRANKLFEDAIRREAEESASGGVVPPIVYRQAAVSAMERRDYEKADSILRQAIWQHLDLPSENRSQLLDLHLLAARNLYLMRRFGSLEPHLKALATDADYVGWSKLLSGGVAWAQGRYPAAVKAYKQAQSTLGRNTLIEVGLADTYIKLGRWEEALPHLQRIRRTLDTSDPEQLTWAQQHNLLEEQLHLQELRAHLYLDQWEEAQDNLRALASSPAMAPKAEAVAIAYQMSKDPESAAERLRNARDKYPDSLELIHLEVTLLVKSDRQEEAERLVETVAERDDLPSQLYLIRWRQAQGKSDEAIEMLTKLEQRFPKRPDLSYVKARLLLASEKPREALQIASKLRQSPDAAGMAASLELVDSLQRGDLDQAAQQMDALAETTPSMTPRMSLLSGMISAGRQDFVGAVEQAAQALDVTNLRQQSRYILLQSILTLAETEGPEKAAAELAPILERQPEDPFLRIVAADLEFKQGEFDEGFRLLDEAEQFAAGRPAIPYLKGAVLAQMGEVDRALEQTKRSLARSDEYLPAHALASRLYLAKQDYSRTIEHARKVLDKNAKQGDMQLLLAESLSQLGRRREAVDVLEKAIEDQPRFLVAYRGLASLYLADRRREQAVEICRQGRKAIPESLQLVVDEIQIHCANKDLEAAQALANQTVGDPPDFAKTLAVGRAFFGSQQFDLARTWAEKCREAAKDDEQKAAVHLLQGEIALLQGQTESDRARLEEARDHFQKVVETIPVHFVAGNNLAWLLATEFDDNERALTVVERVRGDATVAQMPVGFIDTLAVVYRGAGETEKLLELLEAAVATHPSHAVLQFYFGMALADDGKKAAAVTSLRRALQLGQLSDQQKTEAEEKLELLTESD